MTLKESKKPLAFTPLINREQTVTNVNGTVEIKTECRNLVSFDNKIKKTVIKAMHPKKKSPIFSKPLISKMRLFKKNNKSDSENM